MAQQLTDALTDVADDLLSEKTICKHSKPWIDTEIIEKLREQRAAKKKWKRRRSPRNYEKYTELVDQTEKMISEAKDRMVDSRNQAIRRSAAGEKMEDLRPNYKPTA